MRVLKLVGLCLSTAFVTTMISCDSLLDVEAKGNITGNIYTTEDGILKALNGAYFNLGGINDGTDGGELLGGDFILIPSLLVVENSFELNWDDINGSGYSDFTERNVLATNGRVETNWRRAYEAINTLNSILANLDVISSPSKRDRVEGEAMAMRAIIYFEMARLWGPEYVGTGGNQTLNVEVLPMLLEPVEIPVASPAKNTVSEIYDQILSDLTDAAVLLQSRGLNGTHISYYTCQAYLMRLTMHMDDLATAITHADIIINSGLFDLVATPQEAFNNLENSMEDVFAIQQTSAYNSGNISSGTGLVNYYSSLSGQGLGAARVSPFYLTNLFNDFAYSPSFSEIDLRGLVDESVSGTSTVNTVTGAFYTNLLNDITVSPAKYMASDRVIPIIRYAEVLLTRAEASAYLALPAIDVVALGDYNIVRNRAGLPTLLNGDFTDGFAFMDSVLIERRREFLYEGVLYHDMKRRNESINGVPLSDARFSLPIPQSELNAGGRQ